MRSPAVVVIDGNRIQAVNPSELPGDPAEDIDLGDVTLIPGLMDMELNLLIGGPAVPRGCPVRCTVCRTTLPTARCAVR